MKVNIHQAKTHFSRLVAAVENGEADHIEIARAGHVVARLVPAPPQGARTPGAWRGKVRVEDDFDILPAGVQAAFDGD